LNFLIFVLLDTENITSVMNELMDYKAGISAVVRRKVAELKNKN
jgi:hypothetical protein